MGASSSKTAVTPTLRGDQNPSKLSKAFAGFLSHYKLECGTEARLVQLQLKPIIEKNPIEGSRNEVFLDSDDLSDLRQLLDHERPCQQTAQGACWCWRC